MRRKHFFLFAGYQNALPDNSVAERRVDDERHALPRVRQLRRDQEGRLRLLQRLWICGGIPVDGRQVFDCCGVRVLVSRGLTPPQKPTGESGPPPINYLARPRLDVNVGRPLSQGANIEILTFCAILLSPVIAVLITVWLQNRKERRGTKLWVFNRNKNNPPTRPHLHSIQELLFFLVIFIWQTSFCKYRA